MAFYFIGIDVGTQGARVVMIDNTGAIISSAEEVFPLTETSRQEQSPLAWWDACKISLLKMLRQPGGIDTDEIVAISVSSTSGTVIPLDDNREPLFNAIMYSDNRSAEQAKRCIAAAHENQTGGYTAFNTSSGLSKMVWFADNYPEKNELIGSWAHAADYITGKICGTWGITDYTNALKSGFDLTNLRWPEYLTTNLGLKKEWLPEVVPPGTVIGTIEPLLAKELGLPLSLQVAAGITDGCASQIASGAVKPGEWNTTIGTTMVIKGVTIKEVMDPLGRIYNHRHPEGYWMPGGASNTGADWTTLS
jgi:sugar (pentulose or hexulose) kinase